MTPKTVRTVVVRGKRVQLGAPFQLPRTRWGHTPPKPVEPVPGQLPLPGLDED